MANCLYVKPNLSQRRPSDILADALRAQSKLLVTQARKVSAEGMNKKKKKSVRFQLNVDLHECIVEGNSKSLKEMIEVYGNHILKVRDPNGKPLAFTAVQENKVKVLQLLASEGYDFSLTDEKGNTALHLASQNDALEAAKIIAENFKDKNLAVIKNKEGKRPIDYCLSVEMADLLLHADLEHFLQDLEHMWSQEDHLKNTFDGDLSKIPFKEDYLLQYVATNERTEVMKFLKRFDKLCGRSLLHFASERNYTHLGFYLIEHGLGDVDSQDINLWTPLHTAAYNASVDMVLLLIEVGASVFKRDASHQTPMYVAQDELVICILADAAMAECNQDSDSESSSGPWSEESTSDLQFRKPVQSQPVIKE